MNVTAKLCKQKLQYSCEVGETQYCNGSDQILDQPINDPDQSTLLPGIQSKSLPILSGKEKMQPVKEKQSAKSNE